MWRYLPTVKNEVQQYDHGGGLGVEERDVENSTCESRFVGSRPDKDWGHLLPVLRRNDYHITRYSGIRIDRCTESLLPLRFESLSSHTNDMSSKDKVLPAAGPNQTYVEVSALNGGWVTLPEKVE
jgi:hypothetical protein